MTAPTLNRTAITQLADHLETHPNSHDQAVFAERNSCGTVHCAAGWTVVLAGWPLFWVKAAASTEVANKTYNDGRFLPVDLAAQQILGLTDEQANSIFYDFGPRCQIVAKLRDLIGSGQ